MDIFEVLENHKSIREYKSTQVPEELLQKILHAGLRASSSGNMQTWSVVVTSDPKIRQSLFQAHFEQEMLLQAPLLLTFCSDFHRMRRWIKLRDAADNFDNLMSFMIGAIDATIAAQNVALAAEAEGLGICYMGTTLASCDTIAQILELPPNVVPVVGYVMGYPDESPQLRDRLPLSGLVHREKYTKYSDEDIATIYEERETKGWDRYMSVPRLRKMIEESGVENLAQVYTQVKYTQESHKHFSQNVLRCLREQDFMNN
ncbi:nitroreductase family protein [Candidatus Uabimicrobium amorphum]|uniref:NADPH-dependent oxidoreductase n=1 Tax=Uabimicrobium amorphum TaxID=2596890 RepID=A0A5S9F2K8_UABAM|nr:nitroreductase family protein [Candidatus Uabimicrobium amorphum]BBM82569.1 NADPH-dependent oxidoreductase [Candidatus Uabimicrobium amorphum]